ncbi:MAG: hypothetical protein GX957_02815 [Clostridiaceae bacterium]|nr:hypothetical protein [Clostridiaceae bacterium]
MFKNINYIDIDDCHQGNHPIDSGCRGHYRRLWPLGNNKWKVEYKLFPNDVQYCPVYGCNRQCLNCTDYDRDKKRCKGINTIMTTEEIKVLIDKHSLVLEDVSDNIYRGVINATGHEHRPCSLYGGCILCYPCRYKEHKEIENQNI